MFSMMLSYQYAVLSTMQLIEHYFYGHVRSSLAQLWNLRNFIHIRTSQINAEFAQCTVLALSKFLYRWTSKRPRQQCCWYRQFERRRAKPPAWQCEQKPRLQQSWQPSRQSRQPRCYAQRSTTTATASSFERVRFIAVSLSRLAIRAKFCDSSQWGLNSKMMLCVDISRLLQA